MSHINEHNADTEYLNIINDVLENNEFNKLIYERHHGISRFEHSLRVSYYSYKFSKFLKLNYVDATRGGLLHDFYFDSEKKNFTETVKEAFVHPKKAISTASEHFMLNEKQIDCIKSHMFPYCLLNVPKFAESWVVSLVDKGVGMYEFFNTAKYRLSNASTYLFLFMITNLIKLR